MLFFRFVLHSVEKKQDVMFNVCVSVHHFVSDSQEVRLILVESGENMPGSILEHSHNFRFKARQGKCKRDLIDLKHHD